MLHRSSFVNRLSFNLEIYATLVRCLHFIIIIQLVIHNIPLSFTLDLQEDPYYVHSIKT